MTQSVNFAMKSSRNAATLKYKYNGCFCGEKRISEHTEARREWNKAICPRRNPALSSGQPRTSGLKLVYYQPRPPSPQPITRPIARNGTARLSTRPSLCLSFKNNNNNNNVEHKPCPQSNAHPAPQTRPPHPHPRASQARQTTRAPRQSHKEYGINT